MGSSLDKSICCWEGWQDGDVASRQNSSTTLITLQHYTWVNCVFRYLCNYNHHHRCNIIIDNYRVYQRRSHSSYHPSSPAYLQPIPYCTSVDVVLPQLHLHQSLDSRLVQHLQSYHHHHHHLAPQLSHYPQWCQHHLQHLQSHSRDATSI